VFEHMLQQIEVLTHFRGLRQSLPIA